MTLSVLCITKGEPHAAKFLSAMGQIAADCAGEFIVGWDSGDHAVVPSADKIIQVESNGSLESVHDQVLGYCQGDYVLRLDDDERCSSDMAQWLRLGKFLEHDQWRFPRAHLWPSSAPRGSVLLTPHLWPDHQTRLSIREKAGGRNVIHCGSPFGGGETAPVLIEHHKFLVKTLNERRAIVERYDRIMERAGTDFAMFSVPEDYYKGQRFKLVPLNTGRVDTGHYRQDCGSCGKWVTL